MDSSLIKVTPLPGYRLELQFMNGSVALVNMARRINTLRFARLADREVFFTARASENKVVWSDGHYKISVFCSELLDAMLLD